MMRRIGLTLSNCLILIRTFQELCKLQNQKLPTVNLATFSGIHHLHLKQYSLLQYQGLLRWGHPELHATGWGIFWCHRPWPSDHSLLMGQLQIGPSSLPCTQKQKFCAAAIEGIQGFLTRDSGLGSLENIFPAQAEMAFTSPDILKNSVVMALGLCRTMCPIGHVAKVSWGLTWTSGVTLTPAQLFGLRLFQGFHLNPMMNLEMTLLGGGSNVCPPPLGAYPDPRWLISCRNKIKQVWVSDVEEDQNDVICN